MNGRQSRSDSVPVELLWTESGLMKCLQLARTLLEVGVSVLKNILLQQQITIWQNSLEGAERASGISCDSFSRCCQTVCHRPESDFCHFYKTKVAEFVHAICCCSNHSDITEGTLLVPFFFFNQ